MKKKIGKKERRERIVRDSLGQRERKKERDREIEFYRNIEQQGK